MTTHGDDDAFAQARAVLAKLETALGQVMHGQERAIRLLLTGLASGGHVLLEDAPGTGKTTLAKALARSLDLDFKRVQFTPDLLPADILGVTIYRPQTQDFIFHEGPVFTHLLLADEINRASPRTQSALLEAMAENQVSVEGEIRNLPDPFFVIATQNPQEYHGAYPLPESQMDRFGLSFTLGYIPNAQEVAMLEAQQLRHPLETLSPCASLEDAKLLRHAAARIRISQEILGYIVAITSATRTAKSVALGASPRASLAFMRAAQAMVLLEGGEFVTPEHVRELAAVVLAHRISLQEQAKYAGETPRRVVEQILDTIPAPV